MPETPRAERRGAPPPPSRPRLLDLTLPTPAENLALEEALLGGAEREVVESGTTEGYLRFWESRELCVVLGASCRIADDVNVEACRRDGVPVLRRASGGGTVVVGPGCLNVSVVLPLDGWPPLRDVSASHRIIVDRCVGALALPGAHRRGSGDLALGGRKFGGSAQKRTRHVVLHHLTLLYDFPLEAISRYLREPRRRPRYRGAREHREFVTRVPLTAESLRRRLATAWGARPLPRTWAPPAVDRLVARKYGRAEWTERF